MTVGSLASAAISGADWEVDYYSRPVLEADGRKRWELLVCDTPGVGLRAGVEGPTPFRFEKRCSADTVN
ncbi:MAG: Tab2/Atab2 family RNA-binding protein, partial [Cyanobacteriota bacterium]